MSHLLYIEIAIVALILTLFVIYKLKNKSKYPYHKNPFFISMAERRIFFLLQNIVEDKYYIWPQVSIISLLHVNKDTKDFWEFHNKINQKSVDFVLVDKANFNPVVAIEVDDISHFKPDRQERDKFVNKAFEDAGMKLLRFHNKSYTVAELREIVLPAITT